MRAAVKTSRSSYLVVTRSYRRLSYNVDSRGIGEVAAGQPVRISSGVSFQKYRTGSGTVRVISEDSFTYGVERWLTELALALRQETYRPEPIR